MAQTQEPGVQGDLGTHDTYSATAVVTAPWRRWLNVWSVAGAVLGACLGAAAVTVLHTPTYTAEAQLIVGDQTLSAVAVPGYSSATQDLAAAYARLVESDSVNRQVSSLARQLDAVVDVTASPIAESPVVVVSASSTSGRLAGGAANTAGAGLIAAVARDASNDTSLKILQRDYGESIEALTDAKLTLGRAQTRANSVSEDASASVRNGAQQALREASIEVQTLTVQSNAYASAIGDRIAAAANTGASLSWLHHARVVSSNQSSSLQIGALVGALLLFLISPFARQLLGRRLIKARSRSLPRNREDDSSVQNL